MTHRNGRDTYNTQYYTTLCCKRRLASTNSAFRTDSNDVIHINSFPSGQNGRHFTNDIFRSIFVDDKSCILIKISLKCVPKGVIDNNTSISLVNGLVPNRRQAIIWTNTGPIHWRIYICGTRCRWVLNYGCMVIYNMINEQWMRSGCCSPVSDVYLVIR